MKKEETFLTKQEVLSTIRKIDRDLEGVQRRISLYCIGGTYLTLSDGKELSKDMDFIVSREDFRVLSGIATEIELKDKIRLDLFPEGELPNFMLPHYDIHAQRVLSLDHVDVYKIDLIDFVLTKAIAGRDADYEDIANTIKDKASVPKEKLVERFGTIKLAKGKEEEVKKKFWEFVKEFYR